MEPIVFEKYYAKFKSNKLKFPSPAKGPSINEFDFFDDENEEAMLMDRKMKSKDFMSKYRKFLPKNDLTCLEFLFECGPLKRNLMSFYVNDERGKYQKVFISITPKPSVQLDETLFLAEFYHFFKIAKDLQLGMDFSSFFFDLLLNDLNHLALSHKLKDMLSRFSQLDCVLWMFTLSRFIIDSGSSTTIDIENFQSIMTHNRDFIRFRYGLENHPLVENNYWELKEDEFFPREAGIRITEKSIDCIFPDWGLVIHKKSDIGKNRAYTLYAPEDLLNEAMIYNDGAELIQVNRLMKILKNISLEKLQATRCGIMLYGEPGTGKTLLSKMICANLGFHMMEVNSSAIESKYVGETPKAIQRLFKAYENESKNKKVCLVFQEIDSLMGKRVEIERSSDHFMNQAQTSLLQNLDDFKGLLIGTTNQFKEGTTDSAFFRRFLFKLEVNRPSFLTRQQLWKSKLPDHLQKNDHLIHQLSEFDLTGANIQNIVLKADLISSFAEESFLSELLLELANEEANSDGKMRKSQEIGFQRLAS
jgi:ABC-type dipeptide/oligopeptide/nickel transport system ATPase subunit